MIKKRPGLHKRNSGVEIIANHRIRATEVRVLTDSGEMLGIMSKDEALEQARIAEKDLVLVAGTAQPPVVKIIDAAKYKYQVQQKEALQRKSSKAQDLKEVRFTPFMSEGDFESRLKKVVGFLEKGDKVRLSLFFKGRVITKQEFGFAIINKVIAQTTDIASVEVEPKVIGKNLMAQLMPKKKSK